MTQTNYRREFWQTIYAAFTGAANATSEEIGIQWADFALKALDERFPDEPSVKVTIDDKEAARAFINQIKRLECVVDQYSAQLADYRKAGPAKDIEIERLTREGLIKDQKLKDLEKSLQNATVLIDRDKDAIYARDKKLVERSERIAELENTITSLRQTMEVANDLRAQTISEKNDRIAELEKKIEDLLAPADINEPAKRRTAIEWLEDLPEPYRSQALANAKDPAIRYKPDEEMGTFQHGLIMSFFYDKSPEGLKYWQDVEDKMLKGEPLVMVNEKTGEDKLQVKPTTVKGWLELLEEPYRGQALKYAEYRNYSDTPTNNMADAINTFAWDNTPEGWGYWNTLHEKYSAIQDPPQQSNNKNHEDLPF